ncbi:MAG: type II toxin-antitoxin system death-on-curing family toxin [Anaerolineales bacterium]
MSANPILLSLEDALEVHRDQVERYGGSTGIRDLGLLESALAMPQAGIAGQYFHADLYEMAAAYLFHIVKNHPFVDGNKRTGTMAAYAFLGLNGIQVVAPPRDLEALVLAVATGKSQKSDVAVFLRKHARC